MARYARIVGWGKYLPERVLTNFELEKLVDTTDEWIRSRTGIRERRMAAEHETTSTLGTEAARRALMVAGMEPSEVDLVVLATFSAEYHLPASASLVQHALGADRAAAFDLNAACSGFVYALAAASQFILGGLYRNAVVIGAEVLTRALDFTDRSTCVLFGDGAGAVVLEECDEPGGLLSFYLGSDGSGGHHLYVPSPFGSPVSLPTNRQEGRPSYRRAVLHMDGPDVFRFAVTVMPEAARQAVIRAGIAWDDVELFIPHQANDRIIQSAARTLGLPPERVFVNVERYGNTSAASIPIALCESLEEGRLGEGDHLVMVGFGGGLTWGAAVAEWTPSRTPRAVSLPTVAAEVRPR